MSDCDFCRHIDGDGPRSLDWVCPECGVSEADRRAPPVETADTRPRAAFLEDSDHDCGPDCDCDVAVLRRTNEAMREGRAKPTNTVEGLSQKIRRVIVKQLTTKPGETGVDLISQTAWIDSQIEIAIEDYAKSHADSRVRAVLAGFVEPRCIKCGSGAGMHGETHAPFCEIGRALRNPEADQ